MSQIVIIGAGECGVRAAFALREQGFDGSVILVNGEASLPYERPPLSKQMDTKLKLIKNSDAFAEAEITLRSDTSALYIDPSHKTVALSNNSTVNYSKLLIATGARARLFSGMESCLTLRTDEDAADINAQFKPAARIGIIGGGFIGLELAATACQAGSDVTVIEGAKRLLQRAVPEDIATVVRQRHEAEGVKILTGTGVVSANADSITLADGSSLEFDALIAGVGSLPNTELAHKTGLVVTNGIVVDDKFRTSDPHIYAAGDCCNFDWHGQRVRLESWKAAQDQGAHVAAAMLESDQTYNKVPWFWSDQYDLTLQVAGLFNMSAEMHRRATADDTSIVFQCDDDGKLVAAAGIGHGNAIAKDMRILEKLIERNAKVDASIVANPKTSLKQLLKTA